MSSFSKPGEEQERAGEQAQARGEDGHQLGGGGSGHGATLPAFQAA